MKENVRISRTPAEIAGIPGNASQVSHRLWDKPAPRKRDPIPVFIKTVRGPAYAGCGAGSRANRPALCCDTGNQTLIIPPANDG